MGEGYQNLEGEVEKVDEANGRVTVIISIFWTQYTCGAGSLAD